MDGLALLTWARKGFDDGCLKMKEEEEPEILFGCEAVFRREVRLRMRAGVTL